MFNAGFILLSIIDKLNYILLNLRKRLVLKLTLGLLLVFVVVFLFRISSASFVMIDNVSSSICALVDIVVGFDPSKIWVSGEFSLQRDECSVEMVLQWVLILTGIYLAHKVIRFFRMGIFNLPIPD